MLNKILHFIKYNNATVIILALILVLGGGALAAGPEAIGQKQTSVEGVDNTALLSADLDKFSMDFKIEKIDEDGQYYYVSYSFLDLALADQAWRYQLSQKTQKVSKKLKQDLGDYLAKFLAKHYEARLRELKRARAEAEARGEQKRTEVTVYSGLIGRTLDLAAKVFPGYEPVVKRELQSPENAIPLTPFIKGGENGQASGADSLTQIYNDYVAAHPEIFNPPTPLSEGGTDATSTPAVADAPADTVASSTAETPLAPLMGEEPAAPAPAAEPASVQVIELPAAPAETTSVETTPVEPAPIVDAAPAEVAPAEPAPVDATPAPAQ